MNHHERNCKSKDTIVVGGISLYKILPRVFQSYRRLTKDNTELSYLNARKKLTRNIMISLTTDKWFDYYHRVEKCEYNYGKLRIITAGDLIIHVDKLKEKDLRFKFHKRKYEKLTKRLELEMG